MISMMDRQTEVLLVGGPCDGYRIYVAESHDEIPGAVVPDGTRLVRFVRATYRRVYRKDGRTVFVHSPH